MFRFLVVVLLLLCSCKYDQEQEILHGKFLGRKIFIRLDTSHDIVFNVRKYEKIYYQVYNAETQEILEEYFMDSTFQQYPYLSIRLSTGERYIRFSTSDYWNLKDTKGQSIYQKTQEIVVEIEPTLDTLNLDQYWN